MMRGSPLNHLGIYNQLGAAHLWSAWSYPVDGTWKALIGGVDLVAGNVSPVPRSGLTNSSLIKYQAALACPAANSGFYANIGAIGGPHSVLVSGIKLANTTTLFFYLMHAVGVGAAAQPAASGLVKDAQGISAWEGGSGFTLQSSPLFAANPGPFVAIVTYDATLMTLRLNQLTKAMAAIAANAGYATAAYLHCHGYEEPSGSARLQGDSICEVAVFRRILSDADAVSLMQNRCALLGITPAA